MSLSYSLLAYPYAYLVGVLLLFTSALIGRVIIGKITLPPVTQLVLYSIIGVLSVVGVFAIILCAGITYLLPLVALAIYLFIIGIRINKFNPDRFYFKRKNITDCLLIAIPIFLIVFITVAFFFIPPSRNYLYLNNLDFEYYSFLAKNISLHHIESNRWEDTYIYRGVRIPYHYPDIWLCKIVSSVSGLIPYYVYILIIKVYFEGLIALLMYSLTGNLIKNKIIAVIISVGTLFIGSTFFHSFSQDKIPWYLDVDYFPSIINYHGGLVSVTFLCLIFTIMWQGASPYYYYALMACAGVLNILLYPIFIGYLVLNTVAKFILNLRKKESFSVLESVIPIIVCSLFFYYTMKITSPYPANDEWSVIHSLKVPFIVFCRSVLELAAPLIPVVGLFILLYKNRRSKKEFVVSIIIFFLVILGEYSIIYESVRGDIWQLKVIGELPVLFFLGYFGIVTVLNNNKLKIGAMLILILMSVGFSMYAPLYYFGPGPVFGNGDKQYFIKIKKSDIPEIKNTLQGRGNGFALLEDNLRLTPLGVPVTIHLAEACNIDNLAFRINLVHGDTSTIISKNYLKYSAFNNNWVFLPRDSLKLLPLINKLNLQWVYTDKIYYLPDFLKKTYSKKHNFGDFAIYTKD